LPHAVTLLEARDSALDSVSSGGSGLSGVLKITAPNVIGHSVVVPVVAELIADNPALRIDLTLSDGVIDIATSGLDVAVRVAVTSRSIDSVHRTTARCVDAVRNDFGTAS
jgi:DNA-binding transcriptional LysR family regulator